MLPSRSRICLILLASSALACAPTVVKVAHPQISVTPSVLNFGMVGYSSDLPQTLTITNTGGAPLNILSESITGDPSNVFSVQNMPQTLAAGTSTTLAVVMTPPATPALYGGTLNIVSNASNTEQVTVDLSVQIVVPGIDGGTMDSGFDAGPVDSGFDAGPVDSGFDAGPIDSGPIDSGPIDSGPIDAGFDAGPIDAGPPFDAGPEFDAGPIVDGGCWPGLMACSRSCADLQTDPDNCGTCGTFCLTGGCINGVCVACGLDAGYFTLAHGLDAGQFYDLAIDQHNAYWDDAVNGTIAKVALTGGTPTTIADSAEFPFPASFEPWNIASDPNNVYIGNLTGYDVIQVGINGGTPVSIGGASGAAWPSKLAIDQTDTNVYWVTQTTGDVLKAAIGGGAYSTLVAAPSPGASGEQYQMIGTDSSSVYWIQQGSPAASYLDGAILKANLGSGAVSTVASGLSWASEGAVDSENVYWTEEENGVVMKAPSDGSGVPVMLAAGLSNPRNIIVDGAKLYWSAGGTDGSLMSCSGTVQSVPITGGVVMDVVEGQYSAWAVRTDPTHIYWTDLFGGTVNSVPK